MGTSTIRYTPTTAFETFPFPQNISPEQEQNLETLGEAYHEHRRQIMLGMQLGLTKTYNAFHNSELSIINDEWKRLLDALDNGLLLKEVDIKQYKFNKESIYLIKHFLKGEATIGLRKAVEGILKLRELHVQMDEAVLEAYGWGKDALQIMNDELQIVNVGKSSEAVIRKPQEKIDLRHDFYEVDYLPENDRVRFTIHPDARKEVLKRLLELNHKVYEEEIKQGLHKQEDVEKFYAQKNEAIPEEVRLLMGSKGKEKKQGSQKKQVSDGGLFGEGEV